MISVIVPVFNAVKFLPRLLESMEEFDSNNSSMSLEFIFINDGSNDSSLEYLQSQSIIKSKVLTQDNKGVSAARNLGLEHATGDYVWFIDADDTIDGYLPHFEENEIVYFNYNTFTDGKSVESLLTDNQLKDSNEIFLSLIAEDGVTPFLWNKIIPRSQIGDLRFDETIRYGEDIIFLYHLCQKPTIYTKCDSIHYNYYRHEGSLTTARYSKTRLDVLKAYDHIIASITDDDVKHHYLIKREMNATSLVIGAALDEDAHKNIRRFSKVTLSKYPLITKKAKIIKTIISIFGSDSKYVLGLVDKMR